MFKNYLVLPDGLAPPTLLRELCHLLRAFISQVIPRWRPLSLLEGWCLLGRTILVLFRL